MFAKSILPAELTLHAWLELPYFIAVPYSGSFDLSFWNQDIVATIVFRNDLLRLDTWNQWTHPFPEGALPGGLGESWIEPEVSEFRFAPRYCSISEVQNLTAFLNDLGAPYVHASETQTVVEITGNVEGRLPMGPWDNLMDVLPLPHIWTSRILPHVAQVIDAYRIATVPKFRYEAHPVSEALVSQGVAELRDASGKILQQVRYDFDSRGQGKGLGYVLERHDVLTRFSRFVEEVEDLEFENEISVSYCLYHMRRWAEALVVASSVVEALLREAVFKCAESEELAKVLWSAYRTRGEDLFKKVLPALGLAHLPTNSPVLWTAYSVARENRGAFAHGQRSKRFEHAMEDQAKRDLAAFARTARWVSLQINRPWALDVSDPEQEDGFLPEFP